jgi:hypothetical protein
MGPGAIFLTVPPEYALETVAPAGPEVGKG